MDYTQHAPTNRFNPVYNLIVYGIFFFFVFVFYCPMAPPCVVSLIQFTFNVTCRYIVQNVM